MINHFTTTNKHDIVNILTGKRNKTTDLIHAREKGVQAIEYTRDAGSQKIQVPTVNRFNQKLKTKKTSINQLYQDESAVTRTL